MKSKTNYWCLECEEQMVEIGNVGLEHIHKWHYQCPNCKKKIAKVEDYEESYYKKLKK